jgi:hypothetical protein
MRDRRVTILLAIVLGAAVSAGLMFAPDGVLGTAARSGPVSPEHAILEAFRNTPGDAELDRLFDELDARHFSGRLPKAKVLWAGDLDRLDVGDYRLNGMTDGKIILLKAALQDDEAEIRRTLCHEAVHVKLIADGNRLTAHDAPFQTELRRIFEDGCFVAVFASADERASLKDWIDVERARLDAARRHIEAEGATIQLESDRVEQAFRLLNDRITIANAAGTGWPSRGETDAAEQQRTALNDRIVAYNRAVAGNESDQARFNEAVQRYNLMLAYPDGLAEDRAKGLIR